MDTINGHPTKGVEVHSFSGRKYTVKENCNVAFMTRDQLMEYLDYLRRSSEKSRKMQQEEE